MMFMGMGRRRLQRSIWSYRCNAGIAAAAISDSWSMLRRSWIRMTGNAMPHALKPTDEANRGSGSPQAPRQKNYTCLQMAAMSGSTAVVKVILAQQPAEAQTLTDEGETPIFLAAANGHTEVVRLLAQHWPSGVSQPVGSLTPVLIATEKGHTETAAALTFALMTHEVNCTSLLHSAVKSGNLETVTIVVRQWPEAVSQRVNLSTPLHIALERGYIAVAKVMLEAWPAAARDLDSKGLPPVRIAAEKGYAELVPLLAMWPEGTHKPHKGLNALQVACARGHTSTVEALLKAFPRIAKAVPKSARPECNPVWLAAWAGHVEMAAMLLRHWPRGAYTVSPYASLPLNVAVLHGHVAIAKLLVDVLPTLPFDALAHAIRLGKVDLVVMMLRRWFNHPLEPAAAAAACAKVIGQGDAVRVPVVLKPASKGTKPKTYDTHAMLVALHAAAKRDHAEVVGLVARYFPELIFLELDSRAEKDRNRKMTEDERKKCEHQTVPPAVGYVTPMMVPPCHKKPTTSRTAVGDGTPRYTVLQVAVINSHTATVQALLDAFPAKDWSQEAYQAYLCPSWKPKNAHLIELLLPKIDRSVWFDVLLHAAGVGGDPLTVDWFLRLHPEVVTRTENSKRRSAVPEAARHGSTNVLLLLLSRCPDAVRHYLQEESTNFMFITPLELAIRNGHDDTVWFLLDACPAIVKQPMTGNATPIYLAASKGRKVMVELLLQRWPEGALQPVGINTPLVIAVKKGLRRIVQVLLDAHPATVKEPSLKGETPIYIACKLGGHSMIKVVKLLLQRWPEGVRHRVLGNMTPLHAAITSGGFYCTEVLLRACPDAAKDLTAGGLSPLHLAVQQGCPEMVKLVYRCWPDGLRHRADGMTPLLLAVSLNQEMTALSLISDKKIVDDEERKSSVYLAAALGHSSMTNLLGTFWPECILHRYQGTTLLHVAIEKGHTATVKELLAIRPEALNDLTAEGEAPVMLAARLNRSAIIEIFASVRPGIVVERRPARVHGEFQPAGNECDKGRDIDCGCESKR